MNTRIARAVLVTLGVALLARPALAHAGALGGAVPSGSVPAWFVFASGGGVIGASFLLASLVTDHDLIRGINAKGGGVATPEALVGGARSVLSAASVLVLAVIVVVGLVGPAEPQRNLGLLAVWAGWWAGYAMSTYLVGNTWPAINPWRAIARWLPSLERAYPERLGAWPAVGGLLGLVWVEVVSPVAELPWLLSGVVLGYTVVTLAGAVVYGTEQWFGEVDPIARVFRHYGRMAPLQRTDRGIGVRLPGAALADRARPLSTDETAFVVALLWVTTYDGLVSTAAWSAVAEPIVGAGVPPRVLYLAAILAGFGLFLGAYRLAARHARKSADSYVTADYVAGWFAPALVPIAAGYHVAHFLGFFVGLAPALVATLGAPLSPPLHPPVGTLPAWYGAAQMGFIVLGHLVAIWVSHALSFELFPGRLQPIRSQYPFIVVMVCYTATSLWIVSQPYVPTPFL